MSLMGISAEHTSYNWLSINSVSKTQAIYNHLDNNLHINEIYLTFDNDEAGINVYHRVKDRVEREYPNIKIYNSNPVLYNDWNEYIQNVDFREELPFVDWLSKGNETAHRYLVSLINTEEYEVIKKCMKEI